MKTTKIVLLNIVMFFAFVQGAYAKNYTAINTGYWQESSTWDSNGIPPTTGLSSSDSIIINNGITLTIKNISAPYILDYSGNAPFVILIDASGNKTALNLNGTTLKLPDLSAIQIPTTDGGVESYDGTSPNTGHIKFIDGSSNEISSYSYTGSDTSGPTVIKSSNGALPIELISFSAKTEQSGVNINWQTATELNSDYFEIERSKDGENWEVLGSRTAAGNSNQIINYDFKDMTPNRGANYYRLVQVDYDGTTEIFGPIHQNIGDNEEAINMKVYPNPTVDGNVRIELSQNIKSGDIMEISDFSGRLLKTIVMNDGYSNQMINVSDLPKGIYIIRYISNDQELTKKLILE